MRDRVEPLELYSSDAEFIARYRFQRDLILEITDAISGGITKVERGFNVSPVYQVAYIILHTCRNIVKRMVDKESYLFIIY